MTEQTDWPENVLARYLTVGGATVDLTHKLTVHTPPAPLATLASCTGCPTAEEFSHYRVIRGMAMQREEHVPAAAEEQARAWAQSHAETCRAIPKPPVTPPQ
ncbi:hypothetical protein [Streptomyces sp. MBT60]|uniref:hypothetical protein n=1 Tax=Streptomyces sp. MBT60 TaxID=2800409 RepID=UPI00190C5B83|nr:hypothetical protein [Streptomyces sp. MBT60]MBK3547863.1 hypothetical protein [Streptomyces sp. MBT60]